MEGISILLVDDEKFALMAFEQGVDWKALGSQK